MNHLVDALDSDVVEVRNNGAASSIVLICEHASAHIPQEFHSLGLAPETRDSHIAWDPGAMPMAIEMATQLDAVLVASKVSRLVYDCNRPPEAADAMPAQSEIFKVPGNADLSTAQKEARVALYYEPFRTAVAEVVSRKGQPILVTIHSFTPIYHNKQREVEIGVLHDTDSRLADALLDRAEAHLQHKVRRNEPYGPDNGVTHTLKEHALGGGHLNVMLEVRNDLIVDAPAQAAMARAISSWIADALTQTEAA